MSISGYLIAAVTAITSILFIYNKIVSYFQDKAFQKQKAESDERQQEYESQVNDLTKEIQDAKLTFDINKRSLDPDK
jgi:hypothetical protein